MMYYGKFSKKYTEKTLTDSNEHEMGVFGKGDGTQVHIYEYEQAVEFSRNFIRFFF